MSYSAINPTQACDQLSPLTPKSPSHNITTTGRARPNRLWFRRTFSCSSLVDQHHKMGATSRGKTSKHMHGPSNKTTAKCQIPIIINEEATNLDTETAFSTNSSNSKNVCSVSTAKHNAHVCLKAPGCGHEGSPKKASDSKLSLPVINVTCEEIISEQPSTSDKSAHVAVSLEPPSPSRSKSVPGALLAGICLFL